MITYSKFEKIVTNELNINIYSNKDQKEAIESERNQSLFIVAGPGSGKTTVMVLKILKSIFVDDIKPGEILATTFTKKAANELNSRILRWGDYIAKYILNSTINEEILESINKIDFNQIIVGTIDSIAEEILRINRDPSTNLPTIIEDFLADSLMRNIVLKNDFYLNNDLKNYLIDIKCMEDLKNPSIMSNILIDIKNRLYYDQVDIDELLKNEKRDGAKEALKVIIKYISELEDKNLLDFPMLEYKFLRRLNIGKLNNFLSNLKIVLVDEYQDTNLLQEKIYFKLAKSSIKNNGSITVVGDDDQSLYRFRGATVNLFIDFIKRAKEELNIDVKKINLAVNYRSTEEIIDLCNQFVELDNDYQSIRVNEKHKIKYSNIKNKKRYPIKKDNLKKNIPILGMFRPNQELLTKDLSILIKELVEGKIVKKKIKKIINHNKSQSKNHDISEGDFISLKLSETSGSPSDIAILTYSPKETSYGNQLFPHYIKKNLASFKKPIEVFNPRGQDFQSIHEVGIFCGLILQCIDPDEKFQNSMKGIPPIAKKNMRKWRKVADEFIKTNPKPFKPISLKKFVNCWQTRTPYGYEPNIWPKNSSLMELAYKLITWIPKLQSDIEGLVYLEAITQTISQTGIFNEYNSNIYFDDEHIKEEKSIIESIWNIFIPIATGGVSIDECLLDTLPSNKVNLMSIHQSKGLEFPLVIVDVGSMFKENQIKNSFLRFPKKGDKTSNLEDNIRPYSPLGKEIRSPKDRAFDDLIRLYYVAFSRAQDVLLLVGLNSAIEGYIKNGKQKKIPNVALGWKRNEKYVGLGEIYLI